MFRLIARLARQTLAPVPAQLIERRAAISHISRALLAAQNETITIDKIDDQSFATTTITDYNRKNYLSTRIEQLLGCSAEEAKELISKEQSVKKLPPTLVCNLITALLEEGIQPAVILNNPWLLLLQEKDFRSKVDLVRRMKPHKLEDFLPMITMRTDDLLRTIRVFELQANQIPYGNRIYFFSNRLKVEPIVVCRYFVKYPFMFTKCFDAVKENLDVLLRHRIKPIHILKDLRSFRYRPDSNQRRLERAQQAQKDKLMPWMTRCSERTLNKCLELSMEKRDILGENENVREYLKQRLGYGSDIIEYMVRKHPLIVTVRMKKLRNALDFLLDEAGFSPTQIVQVPKVLSHSLETTKARLAEFNSIGYTVTSLSNLCKSKREYQKIVDSWKKQEFRK